MKGAKVYRRGKQDWCFNNQFNQVALNLGNEFRLKLKVWNWEVR